MIACNQSHCRRADVCARLSFLERGATVVASDWLSQLIECADKAEAHLVGGTGRLRRNLRAYVCPPAGARRWHNFSTRSYAARAQGIRRCALCEHTITRASIAPRSPIFFVSQPGNELIYYSELRQARRGDLTKRDHGQVHAKYWQICFPRIVLPPPPPPLRASSLA